MKGHLTGIALGIALWGGLATATTPALTAPQRAALKTAIQGSTDTNTLYVDGNLDGLRALLNSDASPVFWVWRTNVERREIYSRQNDLPISGAQTGFWEWDTFKAQALTEQGTWKEMFMFDTLDFSKVNNRNGVIKIFTGAGAPTAQRDHVLAIGRRPATRLERVFATGTGTTATPGTMVVEGPIEVSELVGL